MPSIYTSNKIVEVYTNLYTSPFGDDSPLPVYSSLPVVQNVKGSCMPCMVCASRKEFLQSFELQPTPENNVYIERIPIAG